MNVLRVWLHRATTSASISMPGFSHFLCVEGLAQTVQRYCFGFRIFPHPGALEVHEVARGPERVSDIPREGADVDAGARGHAAAQVRPGVGEEFDFLDDNGAGFEFDVLPLSHAPVRGRAANFQGAVDRWRLRYCSNELFEGTPYRIAARQCDRRVRALLALGVIGRARF